MMNVSRAASPHLGLRIMKVLYFVQFAAVGVFWTYITVYYRSIGLSGTQIGLIGTLSTLVSIFSMTFWALLNDRFGETRKLLMLVAAGTGLCALGISAARTFGSIVVMACAYGVFASAIIPLLDSTTLGLLGDHPEQYGRQRIWGSIGYVVTTAALGFILERTGLHAMFAIYAIVVGCLVVTATWLPRQHIRLGSFSLHGLNEMIHRPPWLVFAASIFLIGLGFSGISSFVSVTVKAMGGSDVLIGISWTLSAVSELPIMFFSAALLRRMGARQLLAIAFAMYTVRMLIYAIMPTPTWVIGIHAVFGSGFGLYWVSAVNYANELAPAALKTTSQSLLTSMTSLANVIGALMCGWLFDELGPPGLFAILAVFCLVATVMFAAGGLALRRNET